MDLIVAGAVVAAVIALTPLVVFNRLVKLRNRVEAAWADLDVQLTRRSDLVPNLVTVVKAYAAHERDVLQAAAAARERVQRAHTGHGRAAAEFALSEEVSRVLLVAEAYPELKADERFRELSDELVATENKVAFSRQLYNDTVDAYRTAAQSFPGSLIARPLGFELPEFFAAEPAARHTPTIAARDDGRGR